jgi:hypothetical protein
MIQKTRNKTQQDEAQALRQPENDASRLPTSGTTSADSNPELTTKQNGEQLKGF